MTAGGVIDSVIKMMGWEIWDLEGEKYLVGTWTGPDGDLLAVRSCRTYASALYWLSPEARTVAGATARALIVRFTGLRILQWVDSGPVRPWLAMPVMRRFFYTAPGSGYPRRSTWWRPSRVRQWLRLYNESRASASDQADQEGDDP